MIIIKEIRDELKKLAEKSIKRQKEVQIALELAQRCNLIELNTKIIPITNVDELILHLSKEYSWIVATNDRKLRKKLRTHQIPVITLRKKAYLIIEGDIPS